MPTRPPRDRREPVTETVKTNVTGGVSSFVGRVADRIAIAERFEDGAQLVTVTGLGGMGKTRVATRFAEEHAATYCVPGAGGAWLCDLTSAKSAAAACAALAAVLGVRLDGRADEREVIDHLGRALARRKRLLLVLDNFEQLADCAESTLGRWMRAAPSARFLVTSRVALGIAGEHLWPLHPLQIPPAAASDPEPLATVEAVDLFVRRARQIRPDLPLRAEDWLGIADVVRRLDGIPLAIELAAARVAVLSVGQLRERLAQPLDLLVRRGDGGGRHASMRRAIVDSCEQLSEAERACLTGCAVFAGGFTLEAAEAVLGAAGRPILPVLEALCAHSLVRATPCLERGGELRFSLFETIRELSSEHLAAAPDLASRLADRHAAFYAQSGHHLAGLGHELDNLLAAHAHALADPRPCGGARALALALGVDPLLTVRGLFALRLRLLDQAIEKARSGPPASAEMAADVAAALLARGRANRELGHMVQARADFEEGLGLARAARSATLEGLAHMRIGEMVETDGATAEARDRFALALRCVAAAPGDPVARLHEADIRAHVAHAYRREGALESAEREIHAAIALYRAASRPEGLAMVLYEAAVIALFRERYEEARGRFDEALGIVQRNGARQAEGALLGGLGVLLQERGELDGALDHHTRAVDVFREVGNLHREASALYYLAGAYLERGQRGDAENLLDRALGIVRSLGVPRYEALIEGCRATIFAARGDVATASASLAAAERAAAACRSEVALEATVAIHRLHVAMATAGAPARAALLAQARALARAHASDDPRFALRAALAFAAIEGSAGPRNVGKPLLVRAAGRAFRLPGAARDVDLQRRAPLRRILHALARKRLDSPGEGLSLEELLAAGWPGERVRESTGPNRVYVALTTLRNLGLRGLLVSGPSGYVLHPAGPCELEDDGACAG